MRLLWLFAFVVCGACGVTAQQDPGMTYPLQFFRLPPSIAALLPHNQRLSSESGGNLQSQRFKQTHSGDRGNGDGGQANRWRRPQDAGVHRMVTPASIATTQFGPRPGNHHQSQYFHSTDELPGTLLGLPLPPRDTPEVQAARDAHLQHVQAALLHHAHAIDRVQQQQQQQTQHVMPPWHQPALSDSNGVPDGDSLVVESDGHLEPALSDDSELTRYPDLQQVPQALYDPSHVHDPDLEAVIVDADVPSGRRTRSGGRALMISQTEKDKNLQPTVQGQAKSASDISFWPTVPMYIEVKPVHDEPVGKSQLPATENDSLSYSQKAVFANANLPSAVHSFQVPPSRRAQIAVPQLPIFLTPHDTLPLSYSAKASYFHSIPVAAVHDAQVHPSQMGAVKDHQQQPVFHETPVQI